MIRRKEEGIINFFCKIYPFPVKHGEKAGFIVAALNRDGKEKSLYKGNTGSV